MNNYDAEANDPDLTWDSNVGWGKTWNTNTLSWMFRRAPGFCDVVCYTADGTEGRHLSHNLGVVPEMIICKKRVTGGTGQHWGVYHKDLPLDGADTHSQAMFLNNDDPPGGYGFLSGSAHHTASTFRFWATSESAWNEDSGEKFICFMFASCPGVSKVGSYDGTGNDIDIDCGFAAGARFVIAKRFDDDGDWYVWDTTRGIVSGDDPLFILNDDAAQHTDLDFIDPLSAGFTIPSGAPDALNASGGEYIYLAIA